MQPPYSIYLILFSFFLWANDASSKRSTYIVHMDKSSMPKAFSSHHYWYSSLLKSTAPAPLGADKPEVKFIYTYDHAFHGFSAVLSGDEVEALKKSVGFISAYTDSIVTPDTTHSSKFLGLNTAAGLWPASNYGKDVIIGVIDSGIWPESPSFKDDGMTEIPSRWKGVCDGGEDFNSSLCNKKIIGVRYFNQGYRASDPDRELKNSARDDEGHGSHVSSTAAGNFVEGVSFFGYAPGTARGMAPRARLAVYKVLWGGAVSSDLLAAIDQAVADGVDILSISISSTERELYENPLSIASFGAREKGIMVCLSAGNRGPSYGTIRSGIPWAVVVASGTVDRWFAGTLTLGNGKTIIGWTTFPARAVARDLPLVYNQTLSACDSTELLAEAPASSIIVCNLTIVNSYFDSTITYLTQSEFRSAAVIISEDVSIYRFTSFSFPAIVISPTEARDMINYASNSGSPRATIDFQQTVLGREPRAAPALSDDSSRGLAPSYEGILKPDIMAPGVSILAAFNPQITATTLSKNIQLSSPYTLLSGTSMACPHISGIAALLKSAHPDWSPAAIQSAMMTTANPLDNSNQPIREQDNLVASPLGIGSGQVDPNRALDPGLVYDASPQDLVNLVCSMNFTPNQTQTIIKSNYNCSNPSSDLNYPSFVALIPASEAGRTSSQRFQRSVTNVGEGAATYKVMVEAPVNTTVTVRPQTLVFGKKYEKQRYSLTIRYSGDRSLVRDGAVIWIDQAGKYRVRSPIIVTGATDNF
ncbi:subtilisin-like protease SBT3 [Salvia miltiorrhiza]|uniref:subtilisin-like protease SBT3 n=1 Tax=Salvia miltiorrhiza TaxID=226208 RepID=UPI0025AD22B0|nr:subtilisin-like protease SBT3 [Salvia miltiorrhiza]